MNIKVGYYMTIADQPGMIVYAIDILTERMRSLGERVTRVERVVTNWTGDHDDPNNPRRFEELDRKDITVEAQRAAR